MAGFSTYPAVLPALRSAWGMTNTEAGPRRWRVFRRVHARGSAARRPDRSDAGAPDLHARLCAACAWRDGLRACRARRLQRCRDAGDLRRRPRRHLHAWTQGAFGAGPRAAAGTRHRVLHVDVRHRHQSLAAAGRGRDARGADGVPHSSPARQVPSPRRSCCSPRCRAVRTSRPVEPRRLLDFGPIYRNRTAAGIIAGYAAHCWELFALRSWMVAFFAFLAGAHAGTWGMRWGGPALAAAINLLGPPSSILGNEAAGGRRVRAITIVMCISAFCALAAGAGAWLPTDRRRGAGGALLRRDHERLGRADRRVGRDRAGRRPRRCDGAPLLRRVRGRVRGPPGLRRPPRCWRRRYPAGGMGTRIRKSRFYKYLRGFRGRTQPGRHFPLLIF